MDAPGVPPGTGEDARRSTITFGTGEDARGSTITLGTGEDAPSLRNHFGCLLVKDYLVAGAMITFGAGRKYQISPPASTRPMAITWVPLRAPPKTEPRP